MSISMSMKSLGLSNEFISFFNEHGLLEPTDVQAQVVPLFLEKHSVFVVAQTGSGKTYAFTWPLLQLLKQLEASEGIEKRGGHPKALILAPTRELSVQLSKVLKSVTHHVRTRAKLLVGGRHHSGSSNLKKSAFEILIGSPEKIQEQVDHGQLSLKEVRYIILDEVDLLMDMGFAPTIKDIYKRVNPQSGQTPPIQVGLFCATLPPDLPSKIDTIFSPIDFKMIQMEGAHEVVKKTQTINLKMSSRQKMSALRDFLLKNKGQQGVVFFNTKTWLENTYEYLESKKDGLKITLIHGARTPLERKSDMKKFLSGQTPVLFATDVMARGIDIKNLPWVLNFDLPLRVDDYLHRCGRTARMGCSGKVVNFVTPSDVGLITKIDKAIRKQKQLNVDDSEKQRHRFKGNSIGTDH